ncbi:hypothetical protein SBF1_1120002 [Candidatus Desulfosporosinus infrequens]|uniref:Uncharacterized protein n=1 Tax=Candidatus Desulfosporosinus infrequens TaxID=2043169 RepID=A0A2U3JYU1_9FIRM|nr:hypothetical protein SBF1_1120002 [Candidatus Desulfosporosinus infrequens]
MWVGIYRRPITAYSQNMRVHESSNWTSGIHITLVRNVHIGECISLFGSMLLFLRLNGKRPLREEVLHMSKEKFRIYFLNFE